MTCWRRAFGLGVRLPMGLVRAVAELGLTAARRSYCCARYPGVSFAWGAQAGEDCEFEPPVALLRDARASGARIGRYTYVGPGSAIQNACIGRFCSIGPQVLIGLGMHPLGANLATSPVFYRPCAPVPAVVDRLLFADEYRRITIGNDVWIGARAIVKDGVTIGDGAVIGAGAVVTHDVPAYAIAAGVPARVVRYRFDGRMVEEVQRLRWWDRDVEWLRANAAALISGAPESDHAPV